MVEHRGRQIHQLPLMGSDPGGCGGRGKQQVDGRPGQVVQGGRLPLNKVLQREGRSVSGGPAGGNGRQRGPVHGVDHRRIENLPEQRAADPQLLFHPLFQGLPLGAAQLAGQKAALPRRIQQLLPLRRGQIPAGDELRPQIGQRGLRLAGPTRQCIDGIGTAQGDGDLYPIGGHHRTAEQIQPGLRRSRQRRPGQPGPQQRLDRGGAGRLHAGQAVRRQKHLGFHAGVLAPGGPMGAIDADQGPEGQIIEVVHRQFGELAHRHGIEHIGRQGEQRGRGRGAGGRRGGQGIGGLRRPGMQPVGGNGELPGGAVQNIGRKTADAIQRMPVFPLGPVVRRNRGQDGGVDGVDHRQVQILERVRIFPKPGGPLAVVELQQGIGPGAAQRGQAVQRIGRHKQIIEQVRRQLAQAVARLPPPGVNHRAECGARKRQQNRDGAAPTKSRRRIEVAKDHGDDK